MKTSRLLLALFAAVLVSSCANSTPKGRIERNPQLFNALSSKDRDLVYSGTIREGMTRDAVFLAWGAPDETSVGRKGGRDVEQWGYLGQRAVRTNSLNMGWGGGFGPYSRFGYGGCGGFGGGPLGYGYGPGFGYGPGMSSSVMYIPYTAGTVTFRSGRVSEWKSGR